MTAGDTLAAMAPVLPGVMDNVDADDYAHQVFKLNGAPMSPLRTKDDLPCSARRGADQNSSARKEGAARCKAARQIALHGARRGFGAPKGFARARCCRRAKAKEQRVAIDTVLKSNAGQTLFAHLFEICGYNLSNTAADRKTGDYQPLASAYNDARRSVYIDLRNRATVALLAPVELAAEEAQRQGE